MALNYLLSPEFQIVSSSGKPATGGYIETFLHGSRTRYYCASDFDGTLHPFQVPLDSLGGNVVLADDANAYDVYIYNRYGSLLMSRYNVHPSSGGFGGLITSSDGTITVTQIDGGWDLSVTGGKAGTLKAGGDSLSSDGYFSFRKLEGEGDAIYMDNDGHIFLEDGWYHFSATVKLNWNGVESPQCGPIRLSSGFTYDIIDFDFSYNHVDTVVLDGDIYIAPHSSQYISFGRGFTLSVMGMQSGMTAELVDCDIHTILGQGGQGGGEGEKNIHRLLRYYTNAADADENHPVGDWLHDLDAEDPTDPSGHPMVTADQMFEWYEAGQVFDLYEAGADGDIIDWSAVYRMVTWQDQSEWWSQYAPEQGKACRIEFYRAGMYSVPNRVGLIAYIRYKDEDYMRLYEIKPGQSIWMMELQESLPYYGRDTHNGEFLRVKADGSGLEWVAMDLSDYITETDLQSALSTKQDVLTAGSNISIQNNVISATDTTYTAGPGININNDIISVDTSVIATQSDLTSSLADKQDTLTAGQNITIDSNNVISATAASQVNADWTATSGVAEILHKPDLSIYAESANLATVATTGDYDDLTDKPDLSVYAESANLATVATTGDYDDLTNKPDLSVYAESANLATVATTGDYDDLTDKPDLSVYAETSDLATVATTGDYDDLVNKPSIPAAQVNSDWNANSGVAQILNKPNLALKEDVANKAQTLDPQSTTDYPSSAATANFVNSSVATATANFLGNYTLTDLSLTYPATTSQIETALDGYTFSQTPTNNDYVYVEVQNPQTTGIDDEVQRYKFNGTSWLYEYTLNNSSFTAAEKAAIDSGIDSAKVAVYDAHVANGDIHVTLADKTAWNAKQNALTAGSNIQINNDVISATDTTYGAGTGLTLTGTTFAADTTVLATQQDLAGKQNALTAGSNITITGDTISATDTTYSAGTGIDITGTTISADTSVLATQTDLANKQDTLTAGSNIQINSNVISATDTTYSAGTGLSLTGTEFSVDDPLPAHTSSDEGKILKVDSNGDLEWGAESGGTVTDVQVNGTSVVSGGVADITVPAAQVNSDWTASSGVAEILHKPTEKTLTAGANISITEANDIVTISAAGGVQQQADWTEADNTAVTYIQNKPVPKTLTAGANISISEGANTLTISAAAGLPASTSADEGKCLVVDSNGDPEWGTGGKTYTGTDGVVVDNVNDTVGLEAPVDLVAGPGITVDNPDGNTLRVSMATDYEVVLWDKGTGNALGDNVASAQLSEALSNFEYVRFEASWNVYLQSANRTYSFVEKTFKPVAAQFAIDSINGYDSTIGTTYCSISRFSINSDMDTVTFLSKLCWIANNTSTTLALGPTVDRIVGIHRIANN